MSQGKAPFLRRVILRNYKSIRECDVALGPLMLCRQDHDWRGQ